MGEYLADIGVEINQAIVHLYRDAQNSCQVLDSQSFLLEPNMVSHQDLSVRCPRTAYYAVYASCSLRLIWQSTVRVQWLKSRSCLCVSSSLADNQSLQPIIEGASTQIPRPSYNQRCPMLFCVPLVWRGSCFGIRANRKTGICRQSASIQSKRTH